MTNYSARVYNKFYSTFIDINYGTLTSNFVAVVKKRYRCFNVGQRSTSNATNHVWA